MKYNELREKLKKVKNLQYDKKVLVDVNDDWYFIKYIELRCRSIILVLTEDQPQFIPPIGTFMILEDYNDKDIKIELDNKILSIDTLLSIYDTRSTFVEDDLIIISTRV